MPSRRTVVTTVRLPLRIRLLGGLDIEWRGGAAVDLSAKKARALLAYLALETGHPSTRGSLASLFRASQPEAIPHDPAVGRLVVHGRERDGSQVDLEPQVAVEPDQVVRHVGGGGIPLATEARRVAPSAVVGPRRRHDVPVEKPGDLREARADHEGRREHVLVEAGVKHGRLVASELPRGKEVLDADGDRDVHRMRADVPEERLHRRARQVDVKADALQDRGDRALRDGRSRRSQREAAKRAEAEHQAPEESRAHLSEPRRATHRRHRACC
jgi:hypothetical protein